MEILRLLEFNEDNFINLSVAFAKCGDCEAENCEFDCA